MNCWYLWVVEESASLSVPVASNVGRSSFVMVDLRPLFPRLSSRKSLVFVVATALPSPLTLVVPVTPDVDTRVVTSPPSLTARSTAPTTSDGAASAPTTIHVGISLPETKGAGYLSNCANATVEPSIMVAMAPAAKTFLNCIFLHSPFLYNLVCFPESNQA